MSDIVFLSGKRTPFGTFNGVFTDISAIDLGVIAATARAPPSSSTACHGSATTSAPATPSWRDHCASDHADGATTRPPMASAPGARQR